MTTPEPPLWPCEAYGSDPAVIAVGALCFFAEPGKRRCRDAEQCHHHMTVERQRVFDRLQEGAAQGDPVMAEFAGEFPSPDYLLGGPASGDKEPAAPTPDQEREALAARAQAWREDNDGGRMYASESGDDTELVVLLQAGGVEEVAVLYDGAPADSAALICDLFNWALEQLAPREGG